MMMDSRPDAGKDGAKKEMVCKFFKPDVFKSNRNETKRCMCCKKDSWGEQEKRRKVSECEGLKCGQERVRCLMRRCFEFHVHVCVCVQLFCRSHDANARTASCRPLQ
jgi:hypothetical protein